MHVQKIPLLPYNYAVKLLIQFVSFLWIFLTAVIFSIPVFGFMQSRLAEEEQGQGYPVQIGFIKRPPSFTTTIRGNINVAPGGTAGENN